MSAGSVFGYSLLGFSLSVALVNFYLSFLRHPLHRLLKREARYVSGLPLVGTLMLPGAVFLLNGCNRLWAIILAQLILDTGGLLWIALGIGRELWQSFFPKIRPEKNCDED
jgi:hypothetical protein